MFQEIINIVGLKFRVGDTTPRFTSGIEQYKLELVTLNNTFSVAVGSPPFIVSLHTFLNSTKASL